MTLQAAATSGAIPGLVTSAPGAVWVVLPTYNEAPNVERVVTAIRGVLGACAPEGFRVLVVDDGSPDGTGVLADRLAAEHDDVEVLHRPRKEGLGPAYVAGFDHALARGAGYVIEMDADFSHDPASLAPLLARARAGADVVLGSRYVEGGGALEWGLARRLVSRAGCRYARTALGVGVNDLTGGFKCFRAEALRAIDYHAVASRGYAFQIEVTYRGLRLGQRVVEHPIVFRDRRAGRSKMSAGIALEAAWRVAVLRWSARPHAGSEPGRVRRPPASVQFVRFATVGAIGYAVNLATFALVVHTTGAQYRLAATVAFVAAVASNFTWNRRWTFGARDGSRARQGARFLVLSVAAFVFSVAVLSLLAGAAGMGKVPAQAIAILAATPLSFVCNRLWAFGA
jgi:dolichol-phosphate mannosyltransferase